MKPWLSYMPTLICVVKFPEVHGVYVCTQEAVHRNGLCQDELHSCSSYAAGQLLLQIGGKNGRP